MAATKHIPRPCIECRKRNSPGLSYDGSGYCAEHKHIQEQRRKEYKARHDTQRESAHSRGYGHRWREARKGYLRKHPLCVMCGREGVVKAATVVDHIQPHKGDMRLFWDKNNWQPLCERHHNREKQREEREASRNNKKHWTGG